MTDARLDPVVQGLLNAIEASGAPPLHQLSAQEGRVAAKEGLAPLAGDADPLVTTRDARIPGPLGEIPIRIFTPPGEEANRPVSLYFHGGGWVVCDLDTHAPVCSRLASEADAVVVAVDYRLAPEYRFPAAVVDCYAALEWVAAHAEFLGADAQRVCVTGDSAGGNLATVLSIQARDTGGPKIALQALVYPVTNMASFDTDSYAEFASGYYLTRAAMEWFRGHYLGDQDGMHPDASPLFVEDLRGLPPALVLTAECDVLRDEGEAYAHRLRLAGVPVTLTRYDGMVHPFFSMPALLRQSREAIAEVANAIRECGIGRG